MMTRRPYVDAAPRRVVAGGTTSHSTRLANNASQVAGYVFCLLISALSPVRAEDFPDPTRPPASIFAPVAGAGIVRETTEKQSSGLHTVIISETRRAAIIDGQTVELGGEHGDARLIEVNEGSVVLQRAQGRQVLTLFPDVKITRKQTPEKESAEQESQFKQPASKLRSGKHKSRPTAHDEKPLMKPLAIPLGNQTTPTKRLDMSEHPKEEK